MPQPLSQLALQTKQQYGLTPMSTSNEVPCPHAWAQNGQAADAPVSPKKQTILAHIPLQHRTVNINTLAARESKGVARVTWG